MRLTAFLLACLVLSVTTGCSTRDDEKVAWAGVWHVGEALKRGYPVEKGAAILQGMADRHAEVHGYQIDKRDVSMLPPIVGERKDGAE